MINIVMLTRDRPRLLRQSLVTLYENTPHDAFNLCLVDDWSTDPTALNIISAFNEYENFWWASTPPAGHVLADCKNFGVEQSEARFGRGDYLLLCDNDVCFLPGWHRILPPLSSQAAVVGGARHPYHAVNSRHRTRDGYLELTDAVAGTSQLMLWSIWDTYGPLQGNAPGVCQSEDFAFCQRIVADGLFVGYSAPACILDCGITNSDGQPSPGADVKPRVEGVYYQ